MFLEPALFTDGTCDGVGLAVSCGRAIAARLLPGLVLKFASVTEYPKSCFAGASFGAWLAVVTIVGIKSRVASCSARGTAVVLGKLSTCTFRAGQVRCASGFVIESSRLTITATGLTFIGLV